MSDSGNTTPPGWYPDGEGGQRWWDGTQWAAPEQPPAPEASPPTTAMPTSPPPPYAPPPQSAPQAAPMGGSTATATSGRNTKLLFAIIGGLVGVAVLVIVLILALGGGGGASSDDPAETVATFFDAGRDGDCKTAFDLLTDNAKDTFDASEEDCESTDPSEEFGDEISIDIGEAMIDGDDATVPVSLKDDSGDLGPGEFTLEFQLKKESGAWLIDDFGIGDLPQLDLPSPSEFGDEPSSDAPTDPFSDLPSDLFSDLPTDLFSDLPTDLFSDLPTDLFSDFPTDFDPEDYLSDLPSDFPSDFLSDLPTG